MSGLLVTVEGGEGTGKTTQVALLTDRLRSHALTVRCLREPGGTPVGDRVREILLDPTLEGMAPWAEVFLYEACRTSLVATEIVPALERAEVVLCDRFTDSTLAYQGYGRGLDLADLAEMNGRATGGIRPDVTVLFDLDPTEGVTRATEQGADRLEAEGAAFHTAVRDGFLTLAGVEPERFVVVDASGTREAVAEAVWRSLAAHPSFVAAVGDLTG